VFDLGSITNLPFVGAFGFAMLGVAASILLPVLKEALPKPPALAGVVEVTTPPLLSRIWKAAKPYLALALFSAIVALLVMAAAEAAEKPLRAWWEALLAGYVSDSTLQKLVTPAP
jgi:thiol:disulfide interchange protein